MMNEKVKAIFEYLEEVDHVINETRTLKLYDCFFEADELIQEYPVLQEEYKAYDLFYRFCESSYDQFIDYLSEEKIDKNILNYIGRTSSFYITDLHDDKPENVFYTLIDRLYGYTNIEVHADGEVIMSLDDDEAQEDIEYIENDFLNDVKKYLQDAIKVADYIDSFKADQIDIFKDYLGYMNDEEIYRREQQEEQRKEAKLSFIVETASTIIA